MPRQVEGADTAYRGERGEDTLSSTRPHDHQEEAGYSSSSSIEDHDRNGRPVRRRASPAGSDLGYDSPTHKDEDESEDSSSFDWEDEFLPEFLQTLRRAMKVPLGAAPLVEKPRWLNTAQFRAGQAFAQKYYSAVNYAEMLSLTILFSFDDGMRPLIFTEQSGTPFTAFQRYLSTALRVKSWFDTDIWDEKSAGYKNIKTVNAMHQRVSRKVNGMSAEKFNTRIEEILSEKRLCCPLASAMRDDFRSAVCPFFSRGRPDSERPLYFNQCSMSLTQFGFVGLIVTFPGKFGAAKATDEELEGFLHVWRAIGYRLGIEDEFNFCDGSLADIRARCRQLIKYWITPQLSRVSVEWEYYSRCMVKGIGFYIQGLSFEVSFVHLCWVLNVDTAKLKSSLTWRQYFRLQFVKFFLGFALRIPAVLSMFNSTIIKSMLRASKFSEEKLAELQREGSTLCECSATPDDSHKQ